MTGPAAPRPLLIGNDFPPDTGGIQTYVEAVAARLPGVGVVAGAHPHAADADRGYPVYRGPRRFLWPTARTATFVADAVRGHGARVALFTAPFPLPPLGPGLGVPFAVMCHGAELVWPAATPGVAGRYRRWLRRAGLLIAVSRYTAGHLRTLVGPDGPPIRLLPPGVDLERFTPAATVDGARPPRIVSVGRLVPRKGVDVVLRALPSTRHRVAGAELVIVGEGRLRHRLERQKAGLIRAGAVDGDAVTFLGRVPADALAAVYADADVAVLPVRSRWLGLEQEGFGMVSTEAQASGVPVVIGRSGGAPETVVDGATGLVVDARDVEAVADATVAILADPGRRRAMAVAARAHVEARFDWNLLVGRLHADLVALAAGAARRMDSDA